MSISYYVLDGGKKYNQIKRDIKSGKVKGLKYHTLDYSQHINDWDEKAIDGFGIEDKSDNFVWLYNFPSKRIEFVRFASNGDMEYIVGLIATKYNLRLYDPQNDEDMGFAGKEFLDFALSEQKHAENMSKYGTSWYAMNALKSQSDSANKFIRSQRRVIKRRVL